MKRILRYQAGFTLVEVLVAIVLLTVSMVGSSRMLLGSLNATATNKNITMAAALAEDRLATIRRVGYTGALTMAGTEDYGNISYRSNTIRYANYRRVTTVADNTPAANMRTITVTLFWANNRHSYPVTAILAQ